MTCKSDDSRPSRRRIEYPSSARLWRVQHFSTDLGGGKAIQILGAQAGDRSGASLETAAWDTIAGMIHEILNLALSRYVMYACIRVTNRLFSLGQELDRSTAGRNKYAKITRGGIKSRLNQS